MRMVILARHDQPAYQPILAFDAVALHVTPEILHELALGLLLLLVFPRLSWLA